MNEQYIFKSLLRLLKKLILLLVPTFFIYILIVSVVVSIIATNYLENESYDIKALNLPQVLTGEIVAAAIKSHQKQGVYASVTLAQVILESSGNYKNGFSKLAWEYKNLFGIKAYGIENSVLLTTSEYTAGGSSYTTKAKFRVYPSFFKSIEHHGELLNTPTYTRYTKNAKDPDEFARAIHKAGYATAPDYADQLIKIMKMYNLYQFDNPLKAGDGKYTGTFIYPLKTKGIITSGFGRRKSPVSGGSTNHLGTDISVAAGSEIIAVDGGVVIHAGWYGTGGNAVIIKHKDGTESHYYHIMNGGILVYNGQSVSQGQSIGKVGSTGASTGNHLHIGIKIDGRFVDPMLYIRNN